ncbi:MAG: hypothetical protein HYR96_05725 [Deltaproteobacteria bacterium]|nr:hypothetical protein [Deltaproteobacteria bacterium]
MRLVHWLIVGLVVYHGANFVGGGGFAPKRHWMLGTFQLKWGASQREFRILSSWPKATPFFDTAAVLLKDWGYIARYRAHQIPDFIIEVRTVAGEQLFERDEILTLSGAQSREQIIRRVRDQIHVWRARGADVVFVPVPSKLSIVRADVSRLPASSVWEVSHGLGVENASGLYQEFVQGIPEAVDLFSRFQALYRRGVFPFLDDDSHWSSRGIGEMASVVLTRLRPRRDWPLVREGSLAGFHFPTEYLQLPEWYLVRMKAFANHEDLYTVGQAGGEKGRVIVLGTSFCQRLAHTEYGMGPILKRALGRELHEYCEQGGGLWGGIDRMAASGVSVERGDIIVWEAPLAHVFRKAPTGAREGRME